VGYAGARVGPPRIDEQDHQLRLHIPVVEGPQQRLVKLDLVGIVKLDAAKLRQALPLKAGGPFHPVLLEQTLTAIRNFYGEAGYLQAQVSAAEDWNTPHTLVDVTIQVLEGPRRLVDQVIVRGNQATRTDAILRSLGIKSGDPIGQSRPYQLESNLYRLGIFSRVDVNLTGSGLDSAERDLVVQVEEGKYKSLGYGAGYDSEEKLRGLLSFSDNDIGGEADSLRLDLRGSSLDKRFSLFFNQPFISQYSLPLNSTLFYFDTREVSFRVRRTGARTEAVKTVSHTRYSLALDYRVVRLMVDPGEGGMTAQREGTARNTLARFRAEYARHAGEREYEEFVAQIRERSPQFREWWDEHWIKDRILSKLDPSRIGARSESAAAAAPPELRAKLSSKTAEES